MSSSASASDNLSDALNSAATTNSGSGSATASGSGSASQSGSATTSAGGNTITDAPNLSSGSADSSQTLTDAPSLSITLTDLPTLSGFYSYPAPSVPPTADAPYMQRTTLPENFVFIVVGACIAFVALVIIAWRLLTSWSMNRRFGKHESGSGVNPARGAGGKGASYTPLADFKQKPPVSTSHDMKDLSHLPKNFSSVPSLFFSPTAEVARHSMRPPSSRDANHGHLPAGHYRDASRG